jgi:hypothetical protein
VPEDIRPNFPKWNPASALLAGKTQSSSSLTGVVLFREDKTGFSRSGNTAKSQFFNQQPAFFPVIRHALQPSDSGRFFP